MRVKVRCMVIRDPGNGMPEGASIPGEIRGIGGRLACWEGGGD